MPFLQPKSMPEKCFFHTLIRRKDSSNMPLEKKNTTKIVEAIRVISCIFPATLLKTLRTHVGPPCDRYFGFTSNHTKPTQLINT